MQYIIVFLLNLLMTLPLVTIPWFTWWAWISVSVLLTAYYWVRMGHEQNMHTIYMSNASIYKRLSNVCDKLDKVIEFIKRNNSNSDATNDMILSELKKIRKTVRHEVKNL